MKELEQKILARLPQLKYQQWYDIKSDEAMEIIKAIIINTKEIGFYLELNNEKTKFRKLNVVW